MNKQRLLNSIKADIMFQIKHGFYGVYIALSIMYIIVLSFIPPASIKYVLPILIYFDPAGLGLFFIGGMVLLEKEQGVLALLYITPLKVKEYILSKVITLSLISILAGVVISLLSYNSTVNYFLLCVSVFLVSVLFTFIGFLVSTKSKTVNDYLVRMVPVMMLTIIPCASLIPNSIVPPIVSKLLYIVPSVGGLKLVMSSYVGISFMDLALCFIGLVTTNILLLKKVSAILADKVILNA